MDFFSIGNLNGYVKNWKLQAQWNLKQQTGNYSAKGKTLEEWLEAPLQAQEPSPGGQHGDEALRKIHQRLEAGGKLTQKEREYLQAKDPEAYRELVALEREQKAYEQALRRCKTQEEVRRLQAGRVNRSLMVVRSVEHNPRIPLAKKLEIAMVEKRRVDQTAESTRRFVRSGEYARLPTQAEETEALRQKQEQQAPRPEGPQQPGREEPAREERTETPEQRKVRRARAKAAYAAMEHPALAEETAAAASSLAEKG